MSYNRMYKSNNNYLTDYSGSFYVGMELKDLVKNLEKDIEKFNNTAFKK